MDYNLTKKNNLKNEHKNSNSNSNSNSYSYIYDENNINSSYNIHNINNNNNYNNHTDYNNYSNCIKQDNNYKDFIFNKNTKNKNSGNISLLENKILELKNKLEFYKKYEEKLCNDKTEFINNSIGLIDKLICELDKNLINKAQFVRSYKQIEFEF